MGTGSATGRRYDDDEIPYYQKRSLQDEIHAQPSVNPLVSSQKSRRNEIRSQPSVNPPRLSEKSRRHEISNYEERPRPAEIRPQLWSDSVELSENGRSVINRMAPDRTVNRRPSISWPLPPDEKPENFKFDLGSLDETYSVWLAFAGEESKLEDVESEIRQIQQQFLVNMQKESSNQMETIPLSHQSKSATLEGEMSAKSHFCVNLETEEQINILLGQVSTLYLRLDSIIQKRYALLSKQTQLMITRLAEQVQATQQNLLIYAKKRQEGHNQLYNQFLGEYVKVLNDWKAKKMNELQKDVAAEHLKIVNASQTLMLGINQSSSGLRNQILTSVKSSIDTQVNQLIGQIGNAAPSKIGTELKMIIGVRIDGQAGDEFPEGTCPVGGLALDQPKESEQNKLVPAKKPTVKAKTTFAKQTTDQRFQKTTEQVYSTEGL